ncbi:NUDIX domain-containing protein, partial [Devosia sp.]|uniref:NUDIX domain-containing protein n=1 Tax=Devosia sp. TaxID=1871048 RepID=UPI001AC7C27C
MTARHVLSFPMEEGRFNYRVAGIIVADGHVLICREDDDDYAMLPGGRVELGEDSHLSLTREIAEEIALPAEVGAMLATSESFYR